MRVEFLQSIDFNQMLVYSTFAHLLFLTMVMFLPNPRIQEQIVVPTFRLNLVELPSAAKPASTSGKKKEVVAPSVKKRMASKPKSGEGKKEVVVPPVKKRMASKPKRIAKKQERQKIKTLKPKPKNELPPPPKKPVLRDSKTKKNVLADLEALHSSAPKKSILQELDEVARTTPKVRVKNVVPPKPMQEETFKEITKKEVPELPIKLEQKKAPPLADNLEIEVQERKLAELLKESNRVTRLSPVLREKKEVFTKTTKPKQTTASDLIKALEAMEKKNTFLLDVPAEQKQLEELNSVSAFEGSNDTPSAFEVVNDEPLVSVAEKFKELEGSSEEVKMDISQDQMVREEFKTVIRGSEVPVPEIVPGLETSSALSVYVGRVYKRVYSKWKTPLGSKVKKVVVSFTVFRNGNIDKPVIRESAGDDNLDSIAVRAILDSVPFPMLPEELRRPNLRINIIFKYVPEKK